MPSVRTFKSGTSIASEVRRFLRNVLRRYDSLQSLACSGREHGVGKEPCQLSSVIRDRSAVQLCRIADGSNAWRA